MMTPFVAQSYQNRSNLARADRKGPSLKSVVDFRLWWPGVDHIRVAQHTTNHLDIYSTNHKELVKETGT